MKSKIYFVLMAFLCLNVNVSFAQKKVNRALDHFLQSDFVRQFQDMRSEAEKAVLSFKSQQFNYDNRDVIRVRQGYNGTVTQFNNILREVNNDFYTKKSNRDYAENFNYKLKYMMLELEDYYAKHFVQVLRDVKGNYENDGNGIILLLPSLADAFSKIFRELSAMEKDREKMNRELVERKLYQANRFRTWDEIRIEGEPENQYSDYPNSNGGNSDYPREYPDRGQGEHEEYSDYPNSNGDYPDDSRNQDYPDEYLNEEQGNNSPNYPDYNPPVNRSNKDQTRNPNRNYRNQSNRKIPQSRRPIRTDRAKVLRPNSKSSKKRTIPQY